MKMKSKLLLAILQAFLISSLFAAEDTVSVAFRVIGPGRPPGEYEFAGKGKPVRVAVAPDTRSPVQSYRGPAKITFREISPVAREFVATLASTKDLLLLVLSVTPDGRPEIRVLKDDPVSFPMGSTFFMNSGTVPIGLRFGAQSFDLAPGESRLVQADSSKTNFVQVLRDGSSGKEVLFSNNWAESPGQRTLVFLTGDTSEPPKVKVSRISEAQPPAIK